MKTTTTFALMLMVLVAFAIDNAMATDVLTGEDTHLRGIRAEDDMDAILDMEETPGKVC